MRISEEQYYKDMVKALLKDYFAGLKEGKEIKRDNYLKSNSLEILMLKALASFSRVSTLRLGGFLPSIFCRYL